MKDIAPQQPDGCSHLFEVPLDSESSSRKAYLLDHNFMRENSGYLRSELLRRTSTQDSLKEFLPGVHRWVPKLKFPGR
eukprot:450616-Hanusia_phi.AAC.2